MFIAFHIKGRLKIQTAFYSLNQLSKRMMQNDGFFTVRTG